MLLKKILILFLKRPKHWWLYVNVEIGAYFIRRGAGYQIGQPFMLPVKRKGLTVRKKVYIYNLFFNFKENKITHSFSDKPVSGYSERFIQKKRIETSG